MSDRIKLVKEDFDILSKVSGGAKFTDEIIQQILDDQEKAQKWDKLPQQTEGFMKAFNYLQTNHIEEIPKYIQEIKQLKEDLARSMNLSDRGISMIEDRERKLEKIKMFFAQFTVENGQFIRVDAYKLKKIMDE